MSATKKTKSSPAVDAEAQSNPENYEYPSTAAALTLLVSSLSAMFLVSLVCTLYNLCIYCFAKAHLEFPP